jgi:plasmid stabilization system protein ParE
LIAWRHGDGWTTPIAQLYCVRGLAAGSTLRVSDPRRGEEEMKAYRPERFGSGARIVLRSSDDPRPDLRGVLMYVIFYRIFRAGVVIQRVLHSRRDISRIMGS